MSTIAPTRPTSPTILVATPDAGPTSSELYRFNVDQYERMAGAGILTSDDRVELINGYVVKKMPKGPEHVWASMRTGDLLEPLLGDGLCLRREAPARITGLNEPEPDLAIARWARTAYMPRHPEAAEIALLVEVSDTTYHRDRNEKYPAFAKGGIPVYWIVNLAKRQIEVYTDPGPEGYRTQVDYAAGQAVPVVIDGRQIGALAVDDILPPLPVGAPAEGNGA
jgi:Uma2 family endonuclease